MVKLKNASSSVSKDCITESLLILMRKKAFSNITIGEITKKAGVNRSTYYRNFNSKEEIITHSFIKIFLEFAKDNDIYNTYLKNKNAKAIPYKKLLPRLFNHFLKYKHELMLIYRNGLSHCILDGLNEKVIAAGGGKSVEDQYKAYWNIGGFYNSFLWWFSKNMEIPVEKITELFMANFPKKF